MKGEIGGVLLNRFDDSRLEESLFTVVSLGNASATSLNEEDRFELIRLNVRAGSKASENAAFDAAVVYFEAARDLIGPNGWDTDQNLMIRLYNAEAKARYVIGDSVLMDTLIEELVNRDGISVMDKLPAYETRIYAASLDNRFEEAFYIASDVLKKLGFKSIPAKASAIKIVVEYLKTKHAMKGMNTDSILSLPELKDERILMGQEFMDIVSQCRSSHMILKLKYHSHGLSFRYNILIACKDVNLGQAKGCPNYLLPNGQRECQVRA